MCKWFERSGAEQIPKEIEKFVGNKNIIANVFRIQPYDSIMCAYFCIIFVDFMFKGKSLTVSTNLLLPHNFEKNGKIILY